MEIASASATLASGTIPNQWPDIAAMRKGDLASNELESLTQAMEAFISRLSCQLESLRDRLRDAGFVFALPDHTLRAATVGDLAALDAFIEKYGSVPLSVEAWYRQIASFSFGQERPEEITECESRMSDVTLIKTIIPNYIVRHSINRDLAPSELQSQSERFWPTRI